MKKTRIAIATICLLLASSAPVLISEAATILAGTIVGIDQVQWTITLQTREGRTWTLPVTDSSIVRPQIAKGDLVRIEVELDERDLGQRVTKITKIREGQQFEPTQFLNDVRP